MNPLLGGLMLGTLPGTALGHRMLCCDCSGGGRSSPSRETVTTCGEGKPQPGLGQTKQSGNLSQPHHHPARAEAHHCSQVETELVGDVTYTAHGDCCIRDPCNSAVVGTVAPARILAAAGSALAWVFPGLWRG